MHRIAPVIQIAVFAVVMAGVAPTAAPDEPTPTAVAAPSPLPSPAPVVSESEIVPISNPIADSGRENDERTASDLEASRAALDRRIQEFTERLKAAAPGAVSVDEIDIDLVAALEVEQTALADAVRASTRRPRLMSPPFAGKM
jgi:hypothetical protein